MEYVYGDMQICVHECMSSEARRGLELEVQMIVSYLTWCWETFLNLLREQTMHLITEQSPTQPPFKIKRSLVSIFSKGVGPYSFP